MTAKSGFFRACLENPCKESNNRVIELEEDVPSAVQAFLGWLYSGKVDDRVADVNNKTSQFVECYIFAERILCDEYHHQVMDNIKESHWEKVAYVGSQYVQALYNKGLSHTPLALFGLRTMAYRMSTKSARFLEESPNAQIHLNRWLENHDMCKDLTRELLRISGVPYNNPLKSDDCGWHQHNDGKTCGAGAKKNDAV